MPPRRIAEIQPVDRPRERLFALGPASLTATELLAIVIGTGTPTADVIGVARSLLGLGQGSLRALARRPPAELVRVSGVGRAKAARVAAALSLAQRMVDEVQGVPFPVGRPADVFRWCGPRMRDLVVEEFHLLVLDSQNQIVRDLLITKGLLDSSLVHPREVFRPAIAEAAAGVIVVHNHPSGNPTPSPEDRAVTRQLEEAGRILDVPVYDHVIVGGDRFFSFAEAGLL